MDNSDKEVIVWARTNKTYWPGIQVNNCTNLVKAKSDESAIFWFGDYRFSQVKNRNIQNFQENFVQNFKKNKKMSKTWVRGVLEAIKEFGLPETENLNDEQLVAWANNNIENKTASSSGYSTFIREKINKIYKREAVISSDEEVISSNNEEEMISSNNEEVHNLNICLACNSNNAADEHPIFDGFLCAICKERLKRRYFATGYDGIKYFCSICAHSGKLMVCDRHQCDLVYCSKCIQTLANPGAADEIEKIKEWLCFSCNTTSHYNNKIKIRKDWRQNILKLYDIPHDTSGRPLRVLSLFDGIATGLTALINLEIPIQKYFSCEIDENAMSVVKTHFPHGVHFLEDVTKISDADIKEILPIDLLLGGSPCNDLSLVNPARKGLYDPNGTGVLFFEFYRVLKSIETQQRDHRLWWLFENVSSMTNITKDTITRFLQCDPVFINAAEVSSMHRPRLFWGNLPSLNCHAHVEESHLLLDDLLPRRKARVKKLQTVTTNRNSLRQGPKKKAPLLNSRGEPDYPDVRELERIFGFPNNYTRGENQPLARRHAFLGKAWSVKVIMGILYCLREIYH